MMWRPKNLLEIFGQIRFLPYLFVVIHTLLTTPPPLAHLFCTLFLSKNSCQQGEEERKSFKTLII